MPLSPNRGFIEAGREAPQGQDACWLFWEEPSRAHRLRLGCRQACRVRLGAGGRPTAQPRKIFLNQAPQRERRARPRDPRAPKGLQHPLPFHGPRRPRALVKVWSLDREASKIHSTSADAGSHIYNLLRIGWEKMSSTYPEAGIGARAGVLRGTCLPPQVPGKKTCAANGRGPAKPRDARARVTTSHRDGQSACPRNGAHTDQKVGK